MLVGVIAQWERIRLQITRASVQTFVSPNVHMNIGFIVWFYCIVYINEAQNEWRLSHYRILTTLNRTESWILCKYLFAKYLSGYAKRVLVEEE